ncbi:hypothetical protein [Maritalea porphyrae]|uniref:hypothetical protein n=1 Tax=Maritalea porphyrae TaxID=880732 RepID=UPI0022AED582|nr:hypothetical protein [Maritalea porphyrae]MCZ4270782.1 hypothetical protein [Maritalea porphyrae]
MGLRGALETSAAEVEGIKHEKTKRREQGRRRSNRDTRKSKGLGQVQEDRNRKGNGNMTDITKKRHEFMVSGLKAQLETYSLLASRSGRSTNLMNILRPDDCVVFPKVAQLRWFERSYDQFLDQSKTLHHSANSIRLIAIPPHNIDLISHAADRSKVEGKVYFDDTWYEAHAQWAIGLLDSRPEAISAKLKQTPPTQQEFT